MNRTYRWGVALLGLVCLLGSARAVAAGGPLLDVSEPLVAAGETIRVTVLGDPGHFYAVAASTGGSGLVLAGLSLELGADARVVARGQLDAQGRAAFAHAPAFDAAGRVYLQAVTAAAPDFEGMAPTPGKVVRNALVWVPAGGAIADAAPSAELGPTSRTGGTLAHTDLANLFTLGPQTVQTGANGNPGIVVRGASPAQSANLQEWQDSAGTAVAAVHPAGFLLGLPGTLLHHASFLAGIPTGTFGPGVITVGDGFLILDTGLGLNEFVDLKSHAANTVPVVGLDRPGAFLSVRLKSLSNPVPGGAIHVLAGGADGSGTPLRDGFGFKLVSGGVLKGVSIRNGVETEVDLATTLSDLTTDPGADVLAVRRASSIDFYVGGALKGTSTTNLPAEAFSIYEIRLKNSSTDMGGQTLAVYLMTIGIPRF